MVVTTLYIMTQYNTKLHQIWLIPLSPELITGAVLGSLFSDNTLIGYMKTPLVFVRSLGGSLSARNRDLNPIGLKRNLRQHFGSNSNKIMIDAYISPLEKNSDGSFIEQLSQSTATKFAILKHALLEQTKFLLIHNNDYEVVTLDLIDYKENAIKPYIYDLVLQATSIRTYDGYKNYLSRLGLDVGINVLAQNILPSVTF